MSLLFPSFFMDRFSGLLTGYDADGRESVRRAFERFRWNSYFWVSSKDFSIFLSGFFNFLFFSKIFLLLFSFSLVFINTESSI